MRIVLAYGQVSPSLDPEYLSDLKTHLISLKQRFTITFPEEINVGRLVVNLVFDHASADFYHNLFPFLSEHKIKVTLGITPRYIASENAPLIPLSTRLTVPNGLAFQDNIFSVSCPFCSLKEIQDLLTSQYIKPACHGNALKNCVKSPEYGESEIIDSKMILEKKLSRTIDSFIFPFGRYDRPSYQMTQSHYRFSFVNGNTINMNNKPGLLYRICLNDVPSLRNLFSFKELRSYPLRSLREKIRMYSLTF